MKTFVSLLTLLVMLTASLAASQTRQTMTVKVFFSNSKSGFDDCAKVYPVTRTIPKTQAVARAALEQLLGGPTEKERAEGYFSWFSEETKSALLGVNIKDETAYVNLKDIRQIITNASSSCGSTILMAQLDNTLKQFPTIKRAFFAIEGSPEEFYGFQQMECPDELKNCDKSNFK
jgi:spore germination protein GerM